MASLLYIRLHTQSPSYSNSKLLHAFWHICLIHCPGQDSTNCCSIWPKFEISKVSSDSVGQIELKIQPWNLPRDCEFSRVTPYIWQANIQIKTDNARLFKKTQPFSGKVENLGNLTEIRKKLGTKIYNGNKFPERNDTIIVGKSIIA